MIEVTMLIPVTDNSGLEFDEPHHFAFERKALELFGGFTRLPGLAVGGWAQGGVTYRDETRSYLVAVDGLLGSKDTLRELVEFAKAHYRQEAIGVRYLGQFEVL